MAFSIFGMVQGIAVAMTLFSMKTDIKRPYFNLSGEGEIVNNNINTSSSIGFGLAIALVEGITGMILGYMVGVNLAIYVCAGIAAFLFIISIFTYTHKLKKQYNNIGN
jgi:ABC-type methionine transport system permease subunit